MREREVDDDDNIFGLDTWKKLPFTELVKTQSSRLRGSNYQELRFWYVMFEIPSDFNVIFFAVSLFKKVVGPEQFLGVRAQCSTVHKK